jgi:hypothetical protein
MRNLLNSRFIFIYLISYPIFSQDTIVDKTGNVHTGKILTVNQNFNLVSFLEVNDTLYFELTAIQINIKNLEQNNNKLPSFFSQSPHAVKSYKMGIARQFSSYNYSPYSFGVNLFSLVQSTAMQNRDIDRLFASNPNFDVFFQKEMHRKFAIRIPIRIGINPLKDSIQQTTQGYNAYSKEIIGDIGLEPVIYFNGLRKLSWFATPSLCIGLGRKVYNSSEYYSNSSANYFKPLGNAPYFKIGSNFGFQLNITSCIQFGLEYGVYIANNRWVESYMLNKDVMRLTYFGYMGKCIISFRLGGKSKT